jgi:hypothetical protein
MGGIMDLMKNMYQDGDDDMKRTIAQAFTEANRGKKPGMPDMPDMPLDMDMDTPL